MRALTLVNVISQQSHSLQCEWTLKLAVVWSPSLTVCKDFPNAPLTHCNYQTFLCPSSKLNYNAGLKQLDYNSFSQTRQRTDELTFNRYVFTAVNTIQIKIILLLPQRTTRRFFKQNIVRTSICKSTTYYYIHYIIFKISLICVDEQFCLRSMFLFHSLPSIVSEEESINRSELCEQLVLPLTQDK